MKKLQKSWPLNQGSIHNWVHGIQGSFSNKNNQFTFWYLWWWSFFRTFIDVEQDKYSMIKPICKLSFSKFVSTSNKCLQYRIIFMHTNDQHVTLQIFDVDIGSSHFKWVAIYNLWCLVFLCVWFVFRVLIFVAWSRPFCGWKMFSSMLAISNFYWMQRHKHVKVGQLVILGQKVKVGEN